jgi:hypothetical protein
VYGKYRPGISQGSQFPKPIYSIFVLIHKGILRILFMKGLLLLKSYIAEYFYNHHVTIKKKARKNLQLRKAETPLMFNNAN